MSTIVLDEKYAKLPKYAQEELLQLQRTVAKLMKVRLW